MKNIFLKTLVLFFCFASFSNAQETTSLSSPPKIVSSINPIYQIVKFISGDEKNNSLLIAPQLSERRYQIKQSDIEKINEADVLFFVSSDLELGLASNLSKIGTKTKIVELIKAPSIKKISYRGREGEVTDTNIWLSLSNAGAIGVEVVQTLSKLYPQRANEYQKNLQKLYDQGVELEKLTRENMAKIPQKSFVVDLDRLAYFTDYYGLKPAEILRYNYDEEPTMEHITKVNAAIKKEKSVCILGSVQERSGIAWQVANNNKIRMVSVDVIGKASYPKKNGYIAMMEDLITNVSKCVNPKLKINKLSNY